MASYDNPATVENGVVSRDLMSLDLIGGIKQLCRQLGLHDNVESVAISSCESLYRMHTEDMKSNGLHWIVCLVYKAAVDSKSPSGPSDPQTGSLEDMGLTVTELLKATNIRVAEFFHRMKVLKNCWGLSQPVLQHLRQVEIKFLISCALFDKFERMFVEIFDSGDGPSVDAVSGFCDRKQFCWTLFVYVRALAFSQNKGRQELVLAFHLLLCCLEYIIRLTPSFQLRPPFDAVRILVTTSNVDGDILKELCTRYQANVDEVNLVRNTYFDVLVQELPQTDGVIDVQKVVGEYVGQYRSTGDINELDFLTHEHYLTIANPRLEVNNNDGASTPTTQAVQPRPNLLTPVRAALSSIQQLMNILQHSVESPSPALIKYFEKCSSSPVPLILDQLRQLETVFLSSYVGALGEKHLSIAQQRFRLVKRLYFHILEMMLKMEEERLSSSDFTRLLNKDIFHRSLVTCSVEAVMVTYEPQVGLNIQSPSCTPGNNMQPTSILFPWILSVFDLQAFDFFKVIDSFLKAEPRLTTEVVKHLHHVENLILECRVWKTGSEILDLLQQNKSVSPLPGSLLQLTNEIISEEGASSDSGGQTLAQSSFGSPRSDNADRARVTMATESPSASPRRSRSLSIFINKVFKLASQRLQALCSVLHVTGDLQHKIWSCFEYCVLHRAGILRDRHIDQILMCCIYSISKVVDREIKFKAIVAAYRSVYPNVSQQVFKCVLICGDNFDSIIAFYNKVFMQSLKTYILQYSNSRTASSSSSSPSQRVPTFPQQVSPSFQVPGRQFFYVSPMKNSPFKTPQSPSLMTPRTRQLYSFGEGPLSSLKTINERLRSCASAPRSSKCLKFEHSEDVEQHESDSSFECEALLRRKNPSSRKSLVFTDPPSSNGSPQS